MAAREDSECVHGAKPAMRLEVEDRRKDSLGVIHASARVLGKKHLTASEWKMLNF
jgi:hypothetical protein